MKRTMAWAALAAIGLGTVACTPVGTLVGGGAVLTRSVLQERSTADAISDTDMELGIYTRLGNHSGELFRDVSVDVNEGVVLLTGTVPEAEDKVAATKAVWETPGVREISDEIVVAEDSGTAAYWEDVRISNELRYELLTDLDVSSVNYNVTTVDGVVHLTGIARSRSELDRVITHARAVQGVRKVVSHVLSIDDPRRVVRLAKSG